MNRFLIHIFVLLLAATLALPALAERIPFSQPGPNAARIVGEPGDPSKDIFAVRFIAVNGINIPGGGRQALWLEPGRYEVTVTGVTRNLMARGITRGSPERGNNIIELVVEPGKTYYVGMLYERSLKRSPYSTVLYRIVE